jgi:hypothetical protein
MARVIRKKPVKQLDEKKEALILEIIEIYNSIDYTVRIEKGLFKGGFCLLKEKKLFLLNKNLDQDKKINFLLKNLSELNTENIFIKPNIREMMDNATIL